MKGFEKIGIIFVVSVVVAGSGYYLAHALTSGPAPSAGPLANDCVTNVARCPLAHTDSRTATTSAVAVATTSQSTSHTSVRTAQLNTSAQTHATPVGNNASLPTSNLTGSTTNNTAYNIASDTIPMMPDNEEPQNR